MASTGKGITGNVLIHPSAEIGQDCKLGPDVTIGPGCRIAAGVRVTNSALMANVYVGPHTWMKNCIIGWNCKLGSWVGLSQFRIFLIFRTASKESLFLAKMSQSKMNASSMEHSSCRTKPFPPPLPLLGP